MATFISPPPNRPGRGRARGRPLLYQAVILQNLPGKLFTMDNYRSLQTDNICSDGDLCETSLRQYINGLPAMFGNKRDYDSFRKNYPLSENPEGHS